jgi:hypothetical protein
MHVYLAPLDNPLDDRQRIHPWSPRSTPKIIQKISPKTRPANRIASATKTGALTSLSFPCDEAQHHSVIQPIAIWQRAYPAKHHAVKRDVMRRIMASPRVAGIRSACQQ